LKEKTNVIGEEPDPVPLHAPKIPLNLIQASAIRGCLTT